MAQKILIKDLEHLVTVVASLMGIRFIAVDVETHDYTGESSALDMIDASVIGLGFAIKDKAWYVDFGSFVHSRETLECVWSTLEPLLNTRNHTLISHHAPFDLYFIRRELDENIDDKNPFPNCYNWWDTISMAVLVNENLIGVRIELPAEDGANKVVGALSLKALSRVYLNRPQRLWAQDFISWPIEERVDYACDDVLNCYDLAILFSQILKQRNLLDYYEQFVAPQTFVAEHMERNGVQVDTIKLQQDQDTINVEIMELEERMRKIVPPTMSYKYKLRAPWTRAKFIELAEQKQWPLGETKSGKPSVTGKVLEQLAEDYWQEWDWEQVRQPHETPFNPRSNIQLGDYLTTMKVKLPLTPTGKRAVTEEVLKLARFKNPDLEIWTPLFRAKKLAKMKSTYIDGILNVVWHDGTVHPQWNSAGTVTGRYSSTTSKKNKELRHKRGPAMQTVPNPEHIEMTKEEWPYNPREYFIAKAGNVLLIGDLKQAEIRMAAVRSQCPVLKEAILSGRDLHTEMARIVHGDVFDEAPPEEQKGMRSRNKNITFLILYGGGPPAVAERLKISLEKATALVTDWYDTFYGVKEWKAREQQLILRRGYSTTYLGRRRSPVLIQKAPRVTAHPKREPEKFIQQRLQLRLWEACFDEAVRKSKGLHADNLEPRQLESRAVRQCINHEIQGSVGEFINWGTRLIIKGGFLLRIQMHDEIILEVADKPEIIEASTQAMKRRYERTIEGIPFELDVAVGLSWASGKE